MDSVFRTVKNLLIDEPFYGLFLLGLNKRFDNTIETAAVGIDGINPVLLINRDFWYGLSDEMKKGVIKHECNHILLQHLTTNWDYLKQADSVTFNKAADCECNSYIPVLQTDPYCYPSRRWSRHPLCARRTARRDSRAHPARSRRSRRPRARTRAAPGRRRSRTQA